MKILVTGVGGPTPRSFAIALKKYSTRYKDVKLIGTDANPLAIGLYSTLFEKTYVVPKANAANYWSTLEDIIRTNGIEYAIILPEVEVREWAKRKQTAQLPCKALIPDLAVVDLLVDKAKMTELLAPMNLAPKSVSFNRHSVDMEAIRKKLPFPFWVRSSSGTSGLGSLKVNSEEELNQWIDINPKVQDFLASEFLPGRNLACKLLYNNGKLLRSACAERVEYIMSKVAPSGITGNTSFGRLLNEPQLVTVAEEAMRKIFQTTNAEPHGFFTVDFKEGADKTPYITEINVRHVAFTQCFAAGGANFAEDTLMLLTNDASLDSTYKMYKFEEGLIFLRDVDMLPIMMFENQLKTITGQ